MSGAPARTGRALPASAALTALALAALVALLALRADPIPIMLAVLALLVLVPVLLVTAGAWLLQRAPWPALRRLPWAGGALLALAALALGYAAMVAAVDRGLARLDHAAAYADCRKVWSTRGLVDPRHATDARAGNTRATLAAAFAAGAPGVEIDVYFDAALGDFVVSHDFPYEIKDGGLLGLEQLLTGGDPDRHYWLDFKRHQKLSAAQAQAAADRLAAIAAATGIARARFWVEGTEPFNLMPFARAGFSIIFDVHPPRDAHPLTPLVTQVHKAVYLLGGFTVMGMNYGTDEAPIYGPVAQRLLGDIPVFIYHVPTRPALERLVRLPQVRAAMSSDHSADVFGIDACGGGDDARPAA